MEKAPIAAGPLEAFVRPYPLEIQNCSGDDCATLMSKGHHDPAAFKAAAEAYWGEPLNGFDQPMHMWWRAVPDRSGDYRYMYHEAKPGSRGAFPVTTITQW